MDDNNEYGDSDFLANRDKTIHDFRASDKESKRKIIEKMLTLRHNMKYNKHLQSVYTRAKELFDKMVDEHRLQLDHLDEIYRHLNNLIRENLSDAKPKMMMSELVKDKKRIGALLKKMRGSYDKLMDIDTVIGNTVKNINDITFMDDAAAEADNDDIDIEEAEAEEEDSDSEEDDEAPDESEDEEEDEEDEEDDETGEEDDESDDEEDEAEAEAEAEAEEDDDDDDDDDKKSKNGGKKPIFVF
jgi:cobalamin biosynthesis protein CobT